MAGSTFPSFTAGQIARASDVMARTAWLEGGLVPMSAGSTTDAVHDLGTTTAYWRVGYMNSINATSTARGLALGTTTVANNSDVALEISGIRAVLMPRLTTTQRTNLAGINGMEVYDSTLNQFYVYQAGSWQVMLGAPIGLAAAISASTASGVTSTILSISVPGRILSISQLLSTGVTSTSLEFNIDGTVHGDFSCDATVSAAFLVFPSITGQEFLMTTSAIPLAQPFFKSSLAVHHRDSRVLGLTTRLHYERT